MARRPAPPAAPLPLPAAGRPAPLGTYLFGGLYLLMLTTGFAVGFRAGSPVPTSPARPVQVASARTTTTFARSDPTPPPQAEPPPKARAPEPTAPEPTEPDPGPAPEPPPEKKPEPKPEPKKTEPTPKAGAEVAFAKVGPIFKDKCGVCHGGANAKGGLDLRSARAAMQGGDTGEGLKPGDPDNSLIWQMIAEGTMPPKGKPQLTADDKKLIRDWIAGGAK